MWVAILDKYVPNHASTGGTVLHDMLLTLSPDTIPHVVQKIWFYLIGSDFNGEKIWNSGNVYRGDLSKFAAIVNCIDDAMWQSMMKLYNERMIHAYRSEHVMPNRHGHGNYDDGNNPSFYAFGFKEMSDMQQKTNIGWYAM